MQLVCFLLSDDIAMMTKHFCCSEQHAPVATGNRRISFAFLPDPSSSQHSSTNSIDQVGLANAMGGAEGGGLGTLHEKRGNWLVVLLKLGCSSSLQTIEL